MEERMDGDPKTPHEEVFQNDNLTGAGVGVAFSFRRPPAAELLVMQQAHFNEVVKGPRAALGILPFLRHQIGPFLRITLRHCRLKKRLGAGRCGWKLKEAGMARVVGLKAKAG